MDNVQDLMARDLLEETNNENNNDMLQLLEFMRVNGVPLTDNQVKGMFLLNEFGMSDVALFVNGVRPMLTPTKTYMQLVDKITMADRIKGTAKLSQLMKAQVTNPNNTVPSAEMQPKALREKELNR